MDRQEKKFKIELLDKDEIETIHFVGIGGAGMSGLAHVLAKSGYVVTGSDIAESDITHKLALEGIKICRGHKGSNVDRADLLVFSSAVSSENPELRWAMKHGILSVPRAKVLAEMMKLKVGVAIAGTHGKTTTVSLLSLMLKDAGIDPTILVGGELAEIGGTGFLGEGKHLVAEADESDGSFLELEPEFACITNIENDHMDYYGSLDALIGAFGLFAEKVISVGGMVFISDHPNNLKVARQVPQSANGFYMFGLDKKCRIRAVDINKCFGESTFSILADGKKLGKVKLRLPGVHNIYNALGACALAMRIGVGFETIKDVLGSYRGTKRRFEQKGDIDGVLLFEDYAHHPTEIAVTLESCKNSGRRILAVFQPHRYTRTRDLANQIAKALSLADFVIVTDIYPAGEKKLQNVSSKIIVDEMKKTGYKSIRYVPDKWDAVDMIVNMCRKQDLVIILGAGDINKVCQPVLDRLEKRKGC